MSLSIPNEKYRKLFNDVQQHHLDEVLIDINEDHFVTFINVHGRCDKVSVYFSGQDKDVNIDEVIDLTTDYFVAKGFEKMAGKNGVVFAFDYDFVRKRQFVSMDYLTEFLEENGFDISWYKTEREIILSKDRNLIKSATE